MYPKETISMKKDTTNPPIGKISLEKLGTSIPIPPAKYGNVVSINIA